MKTKTLLFILIVVLLLAACGKKGPVKPKPTTSQSTQIQSSVMS